MANTIPRQFEEVLLLDRLNLKRCRKSVIGGGSRPVFVIFNWPNWPMPSSELLHTDYDCSEMLFMNVREQEISCLIEKSIPNSELTDTAILTILICCRYTAR